MIRVGIAYTFHDRDWLGGRNYFASLLEAIEAHAKDALGVTLVTGRRTATDLPAQFPWMQVVRSSALDRHHPLWLMRQADLRAWGRDRILDRILSDAGVELLSHSGRLGQGSEVPCVDWLYDFQFMHLPELWKPRQARWAAKRFRASCRTCDGVIVSSQCALRDLRSFEPRCRARVHVLPFVSNRIVAGELPPPESLRARYALPSRFFYLPNQFWENKNHRLVVDALGLLLRAGIEAHVVCSGKTTDGRQPHYFPELLEHVRRSGIADRFRILGIIPRADSLGMMRAADAVLNPSRFEGWSTTVEEAKTLGVPLILSDIEVHREQVGSQGTFIDPDGPDSLAQALARHLQEAPVALERPHPSYDERLRTFAERYLAIVERTLDDRKSAATPH